MYLDYCADNDILWHTFFSIHAYLYGDDIHTHCVMNVLGRRLP